MEKTVELRTNSTLAVLALNPMIFSAILILLHSTSGYSEIHFYFAIHSEIAEINVSGIINPFLSTEN